MKLKNIFIGILFSSAAMISCKKDNDVSAGGGFIKSFGSDSNMVVVGNIQQGNHIIIVCRSMNESVAGTMYKMDLQGNMLWKKPVPAENRVLWQVYDLPGSGFATVGYGDVSRSEIVICFYNDDADFLYSRQLPWQTSWGPGDIGPVQMLQLSTGGFVFAASVAYSYSYVVYTNSNIDSLTRVETTLSVPGNFTWGYVVSPRGICEMPDSTVMISAAFSPQIVNPNNYDSDFRWQTLVYRLDFTGQVKSLTLMGDSLHNETPSALLKMGGDVFLVTGRMGETHDGSGVFVNYLNNQMGFLCSGEINLLRVSALGNLIARNTVRNYTANGLIMNARPTSDGGYILCGTVNQSTALSIISPTKIYIMKVNSGGSYEWSRTFTTTYPSYGVDAVQMPDGGYFVTGYEKAFDTKFNAVVIRTDANGTI